MDPLRDRRPREQDTYSHHIRALLLADIARSSAQPLFGLIFSFTEVIGHFWCNVFFNSLLASVNEEVDCRVESDEGVGEILGYGQPNRPFTHLCTIL